MRVRRAVLGEMKERKEGGLYYTKPFRSLMNCFLDVEDFLGGTLTSANAKSPDYFYRQLSSFYKSVSYIVRNTERITADALQTLKELKIALEKEVFDLRRFRQRIGSVEVYTYADRIARREELVKETEKVAEKVTLIGEKITALTEFFLYLRCQKEFTEIGRGEGFIDIVRYFYRETVKKYKYKYGMKSSKMYTSDAYALCVICSNLTDRLSPVYSYVFVDEAQDVSVCEYELLKKINKKASFNVFGDLAQNVTPWRGVRDWKDVFPKDDIYTLNQNYRNTNQIVDFVSSALDLDMQPIGFDGPPVEYISARNISGFFKNKKGLKAIICSEKCKAEYLRKSYNELSVKGKVSRNKINLMTVYESKGLEFSSVCVVEDGLSSAERYIAYTRALKDLAVIKAKKQVNE